MYLLGSESGKNSPNPALICTLLLLILGVAYGTTPIHDPNAARHVPLTVGQKARLLFDCLPLPVMVLALVFAMTVVEEIVGQPPPTALILFLGFVTLVAAWTTVQRVRDRISGVAWVQEDLLHRSYRSSGQGPGRYYGRCEWLGRLRLTPKCHFQRDNGRHYQVVYSPASKIVWQLEPLDHTAM